MKGFSGKVYLRTVLKISFKTCPHLPLSISLFVQMICFLYTVHMVLLLLFVQFMPSFTNLTCVNFYPGCSVFSLSSALMSNFDKKVYTFINLFYSNLWVTTEPPQLVQLIGIDSLQSFIEVNWEKEVVESVFIMPVMLAQWSRLCVAE